MTGSAKAALAATLLVLAACGGGSAGNDSMNKAGAPANDADANAATAEPAKPVENAGSENVAAAAAVPADGTVTREFLVGRWTEEEMSDCAGAATEFRANGTFAFPWGDTGTWSLDGDRMTMSSNTNVLRIRAIDRNTIEIRSPSRTYRTTRCT